MKLYYAPGACSLADHLALEESGLAYSTEKVDLKAKRTETGKDFALVNPKGYVPALELDDGEILTENIAVLLYIADKTGKLIPGGGLPRWRVVETLAYVSTELHKNFKPFFNPAATDADRAEAKKTLEKRLALLDAGLGGRSYIVGEDISVADCYLFVMLMWARKNGVEAGSGLSRYFDGLKQRPAFAAALKAEGLA